VADLRVELLVVEDCPHLAQARRDLDSILGGGVIEVPVQLIYVSSLEDAEFLAFQGSPTIRVDGDDVVPEPDLPIAMGCRLYRAADGPTIGSPPRELIKAAVDAHRRGRLRDFQRQEAAKVAEFARAADAEAGGRDPDRAATEPSPEPAAEPAPHPPPDRAASGLSPDALAAEPSAEPQSNPRRSR